MTAAVFDFDEYRAAVEGGDLDRWLASYRDDAEWLELRAHDPPRSPNVMRGREEIRAFLASTLRGGPLEISLSHELVGAIASRIERPSRSTVGAASWST